MKSYNQFFHVQTGRYYVAVSLLEAETLRAAIHQRMRSPLIPSTTASVPCQPDVCLVLVPYSATLES